MDIGNFYKGLEFEAHEYLGAHTYFGGTTFRVYAPNAKGVTLICDFNDWFEIPMNRCADGRFWETSVPDTKAGNLYKYKIYNSRGGATEHADPYAFYSELRPGTASIIYDRHFVFDDDEWMAKRGDMKQSPMNIYELHFGSWKKKDDEDPEGGWYSYEELAPLLIPYLKEYGYNALEIMPLNEYPCDQSWGYQSTGYFSPTARYGEPDGLRFFVNECHKNGIAVILDFIPVHFAVDYYGLREFDGSALFEYPHASIGFNEWGSCNFNHSKGEICSFLQSSANYWLKDFHFDGLRMDAVGNLIYWQGNSNRGVNTNALKFLKTMNDGLRYRNPGIMLMAEDSSSYPGVTKPTRYGGLGFDYKWDMGWMNDTLSYFATSADYRGEIYHRLTFSMMYFSSEYFILPLSHDEVVHGKATIVQKMSDLYEGKFTQARAFYMYMFAHPGKKLNFMGNELGQLREWDEKRGQDWDILKYPIHDAFHRFAKELNNLYLKSPALYKWDYEKNGFEWVDCHDETRLIYAFRRNSDEQCMLCIFNFSYFEQDYELCLDYECSLKPVLSSDWEEYDGNSKKNTEPFVVNGPVNLKLAPYSAYFYEFI